MIQQNKISKTLLFLVAFTLPMYMGLNNIVLGIYLIWVLIITIKKKEKPNRKSLKNYIPVIIFFVLALIASINSSDTFFFKNLESYLSFLLIPIAVWLQKDDIIDQIPYALKGLVYGCATTLIICYCYAVFEIITNNEPWSYFLRWRHLSHDFTEIADTHPAYLGLFICTSTFYLLFNKPNGFNKRLKIALLMLFSLGLLQLASRIALLIYVLIFSAFLIYKVVKFKKQIILFVIFLGVVFSLFFSFGSNYLKDRIFSTESIEKDNRFERLKVSYEIFKEHPILGVGFDKIEDKRVIEYTNHGYIVAAHFKHNAHNQFVEFLSINGILGAILYVLVFIVLTIIAIKHKDCLFLFIILSFFIANITESMMVRIKGIEYFALFISLFLTKQVTDIEYKHH